MSKVGVRSFYVLSLFLTLAVMAPADHCHAQGFLKKLKDKTLDKLSDRASEELSAMAVEAMMQPIRKKRYQLMREQYKEQYGEDFDESQYETPEEAEAALYASMISFYGDVDLPDSYAFDYRAEIETKENKEKQNFNMLISTTQSLFGMEFNEKGNRGKMIIDYDRDIMVTYDDEKKEAFAMKGMFKMAQAAGTAYSENPEWQESDDISFEPLSKTRKVAGCEAEGYRVKSEDGQGEAYYCDNLPFDWKDIFGSMMNKMSPESHKGYSSYYAKGMPVYAKFKEKNGDESSWELKDISQDYLTIENSDYTLANDQFGK